MRRDAWPAFSSRTASIVIIERHVSASWPPHESVHAATPGHHGLAGVIPHLPRSAASLLAASPIAPHTKRRAQGPHGPFPLPTRFESGQVSCFPSSGLPAKPNRRAARVTRRSRRRSSVALIGSGCWVAIDYQAMHAWSLRSRERPLLGRKLRNHADPSHVDSSQRIRSMDVFRHGEVWMSSVLASCSRKLYRYAKGG